MKWNRPVRGPVIGICTVLVLAALVTSTWAFTRGSDAPKSDSTSTTLPTSAPSTLAPLQAPRSTDAQDAQFLTDVTEVDPSLTSYEKKSGNVALRSLLTDGSAFCDFLYRDRSIDSAMVSVVVGARHVESRTRLPMSVAT